MVVIIHLICYSARFGVVRDALQYREEGGRGRGGEGEREGGGRERERETGHGRVVNNYQQLTLEM